MTAYLVLLPLSFCGCSGSTAPTPAPNTPSLAWQAAFTDASLSSSEYVRLGVPAWDRLWSGQDMAQAAEALAAIAEKDPAQLPVYQSARSGQVFGRITAVDNLGFFHNKSLPLESRMPQMLMYQQSSNQIFKTYFAAFLKKATRDEEIIELLGLNMRVVRVMTELNDEFLPTLSKDDPSYEIRMGGLQKMKEGLGTMITGGLLAVTEKDAYRVPARRRLIAYMQEMVPAVLPQLSRDVQSEMLIRIEKMTSDPGLQDLQPDLNQLRAKTKAALN